jgi:hypothetical protein
VSFFVSSVKPRNRVATLTVAGQTVKVR